MPGSAVLADIGGTNARFALLRGGRLSSPRCVAVADFPSLNAALHAYLAACPRGRGPTRMALAVAGPITGETVRLTNSPWRISGRALRAAFGFADVILINDFAAIARAIRHLRTSHWRAIGGGEAARSAPVAALGPGTGLGVAGLVPAPGGPRLLVGEGGHVTMAPADDRDSALLDHLRARFGHVSAERVLSGAGLVNLYETIAEMDGLTCPRRTAPEITETAIAGTCAASAAALSAFCAMLGTFSGNLALTLGARGGVYLAGGIVPRIVDFVTASAFRERFEGKGRFRDYLATIPTRAIVHPQPAFLGLRALLDQSD